MATTMPIDNGNRAIGMTSNDENSRPLNVDVQQQKTFDKLKAALSRPRGQKRRRSSEELPQEVDTTAVEPAPKQRRLSSWVGSTLSHVAQVAGTKCGEVGTQVAAGYTRSRIAASALTGKVINGPEGGWSVARRAFTTRVATTAESGRVVFANKLSAMGRSFKRSPSQPLPPQPDDTGAEEPAAPSSQGPAVQDSLAEADTAPAAHEDLAETDAAPGVQEALPEAEAAPALQEDLAEADAAPAAEENLTKEPEEAEAQADAEPAADVGIDEEEEREEHRQEEVVEPPLLEERPAEEFEAEEGEADEMLQLQEEQEEDVFETGVEEETQAQAVEMLESEKNEEVTAGATEEVADEISDSEVGEEDSRIAVDPYSEAIYEVPASHEMEWDTAFSQQEEELNITEDADMLVENPFLSASVEEVMDVPRPIVSELMRQL